MKSILSGGMKQQEATYLSVRTLCAKVRARPTHGADVRNSHPSLAHLRTHLLCAKVLGLVLALGGGLPLGKEGPFVDPSVGNLSLRQDRMARMAVTESAGCAQILFSR